MLSRRKFVGTTLAAGATLATSQPAAAQPAKKRTIVDAQVHLWKASSPDYPWNPGAKPQLPEPMTVERVLPMMDEAGVDRVIIVPPALNDINAYAIEAHKRYPNRFAVMGRIPLKEPKAAALLPKWKEQPGMLGLRLTFFGAAQSWLTDGTADWFWPACEKADLPVMLLAAQAGPPIARVAERHPKLTMIIDHMGVAPAAIPAGRVAEYIGHTLSLSKYPNVSVKLSAVPWMSKEPYPYRDINTHIQRLFEAYGPRRCYWGTDITNSLAKATYRQRLAHFTETLDFMSEEDKDWVMGRAILERLKWA